MSKLKQFFDAISDMTKGYMEREIKQFTDFPTILVKKPNTEYIKEFDIMSFIEFYKNHKDSIMGAFKQKSSFFPISWKNYAFFEEKYKKIPADEKQKKRMTKLNIYFDENILFFEAKELIKEAERLLPPTPAVKNKNTEQKTQTNNVSLYFSTKTPF